MRLVKLIHFTAPNGGTVGIVTDQVEEVRDAAPGEYAPGAKAVIVLVSGFHAVRETREEVEKRLEGS